MKFLNIDIKKFIPYINDAVDMDDALPFGGLKKDAPEEARKEYEKLCKQDAEMKAVGEK